MAQKLTHLNCFMRAFFKRTDTPLELFLWMSKLFLAHCIITSPHYVEVGTLAMGHS